MINHTSVISGDLPDYLQCAHEWSRPQRRYPPPAKGRKAILNSVSSDAPASFLLKHIHPSSPSARKSAFFSPSTPDKEGRLIQELRVSRFRDFQRFNYEDFSPDRNETVDYASLPMGVGVDLLKGNAEGAKSKLPFYIAHAAAVKAGKFPMKHGMFSYKAGQKSVGRADGSLLRALRSVSTGRSKLRQSVPEYQKREGSIRTPTGGKSEVNYFGVYCGRMAIPNAKAVRSILMSSSSRKRPAKRAASQVHLDFSRDIAIFDELHKVDSQEFHPVTKKSLGSPR